MEFIEEAGLMDAVRSAGFQLKNGAAFACGNAYTYFDFREKFSPGPGTTYQVQRAHSTRYWPTRPNAKAYRYATSRK